MKTAAYLELLLEFPNLLLFLLTFEFFLFLFPLWWSQDYVLPYEAGIATHLEFFLTFLSFLLSLLTFKLLSPPFPLQRGQKGVLS